MIFNNIRSKLIVFFIIIMFIPSILISSVMYNISTKTLIERKVNDISNDLGQIQNRIDSVLKDIEYLLTGFSVDLDNIDRLQEFTYHNELDHSLNHKSIWSDIKKLQKLNPNVEGVFVYLYNNKILINSSETRRVTRIKNPNLYEWINSPISQNGNSGWNQIITFTDNYSKPVRVFLHKKEIESLGQVAVLVNERLINYNYLNMYHSDQKEQGRILILDEKGTIISDKNDINTGLNISNEKYIKKILSSNQGYFLDNINGEETLCIYTTSQYTNWKYVSMISMENVVLDRRQVNKGIFYVNLISIIIAVFLAIIFSKSIDQPIQELKEAMQTVENGNLSIQIQTMRKDEFKILYKGFNRMIINIKELMKQLYEEKLLKKEAELKNLQAQIDPHFLYNTLNSIHWMARLNKLEEVGKVTLSLSNFYKGRLNTGNKFSTIRETVDLISEFLNIKRIRYGGRFNIDIKVEEGLKDIKILHLLILPIVENAIYHGIEKKSNADYIGIHVFSQDENLIFEIIDNGIGMQQQRLYEIRRQLEILNGEDNEEYLALVNIQQRIKLHYGEHYGIDIRSSYGEGTIVKLVLPKLRGNTKEG